MKRSFSLIELIVAISLVAIVLATINYKPNDTNLLEAANKLKLYLNFTRYIAFIDNKEDINDSEYYRRYWTLKFKNCKKDLGGLYFIVYSDLNKGGQPNKSESLKDPLSNKYLYSNYDCKAGEDESKYILLTKEYGIEKVDISCNTTSSLGQFSFSNDGKVYSSLGKTPELIKQRCYLNLYDQNNRIKTITIEPNTGYIY